MKCDIYYRRVPAYPISRALVGETVLPAGLVPYDQIPKAGFDWVLQVETQLLGQPIEAHLARIYIALNDGYPAGSHPGVVFLENDGAPERLRSMSCGDYFRTDRNEWWVVATCGYQRVPELEALEAQLSAEWSSLLDAPVRFTPDPAWFEELQAAGRVPATRLTTLPLGTPHHCGADRTHRQEGRQSPYCDRCGGSWA